MTNQQFDELNSLVNLKNKLYGNSILNNIEFEKKYLEKYFKFNPLIINEVNKYIEIYIYI